MPFGWGGFDAANIMTLGQPAVPQVSNAFRLGGL